MGARIRHRGAVACLVLLGAGACAEPAQRRYENRAAGAPAAGAHAVHAERLAALMDGLDRLRGERLPQALDVEAARSQRVALVADVATAIADSALRIPEAAGAVPLDPADRASFDALAANLASAASRLAADAPTLSDAELRARTREIELTCDRCHARHRAPR